jgi:L-2-hydroxyglutarate oxidase LhgO
LRHRLCVAGRRELHDYLARRGVAHRKCGKLIVATSPDEEAEIGALHRRALENGVEGMSALTGAQARALEPNLKCLAALLSSETGILDSHGYMLALRGELESAGGAIAFNAPLLGGRALGGGGFEMRIGGATPGVVKCAVVVNAAGLSAHAVARSIEGMPTEHIPPLVLAKGSYFSCLGKPAFQRLIYPAPVEGGLGVHLTLDLAGAMRFGPDVEWIASNDPAQVDYKVDPTRANAFYAAIRRYWPQLPNEALSPDYSGCRPKLSGPGQASADFRIDGPAAHGLDGLVNLFGIESPGLTASLAIGEYVVAAINARAPDTA